MSIRDSLLRALGGKTGERLSGEVLAQELGVSRTAIWKQLKSLRDIGLPLESEQRHGYHLKIPFDSSLMSYRGPSWIRPHYQVTTASTQTLAKAGASAGLPEGHLWITELQTKGRGRLDRRWDSGFGGLWFSFLLRPRLSPLRVAPITLVTGLCLREAIEKTCKLKVALKWPNDVMLQSGKTWKKCAGILTEMSGQVEQTEWVVIGVGINVANVLPDELRERAASLSKEKGGMIIRARLLDVFLSLFHSRYAQFCKNGFESFRDAYWEHYFSPGRQVCLKTATGEASGRAVGVDASGALMIESRRKAMHFNEGEIVL